MARPEATPTPARRVGKEPMPQTQKRRHGTPTGAASGLRSPITPATELRTARCSEAAVGLTPWSLCTSVQEGKSQNTVAHANIATVLDENKKTWVDRELLPRPHDDFARKASMQTNKSSSACVWACPKRHNLLNERQFSVVAERFFGVAQECLKDLTRKTIQQKFGGGRDDKTARCDACGENSVKATLP
jgi:hypothetical protein